MYLQSIITQINQAIGAAGVVNKECKSVVEQYGPTIMDLLLAEVKENNCIFEYIYKYMCVCKILLTCVT